MTRLLVITSRFPYPLEKGDKLRIYYQIKDLSKVFKICLIALNDETVEDDSYTHIASMVDELHMVQVGGLSRLLGLLTAVFTKNPFQISYFYSKKAKRSVQDIVDQFKPDLIYSHLLRAGQYVEHMKHPVYIDYMDAFSLIMKRRAASSRWIKSLFYKVEAHRMKAHEITSSNRYQGKAIISKQDQQYLESLMDSKFDVISNGVDLERFYPLEDVEKKYDIVFVGNMGYPPNIKAAFFIAQQLLPILLKTKPNIKVLIAGARPTRGVQFLASEHIAVSGYIEDIRLAYASSHVFVAPIFNGAGQQNKILESMAMGIPCVTTQLVNNAIGASNQESICLADESELMSKHILELLHNRDHYNYIRANAFTFVQSCYTWETQNNKLIQNLKALKP